MAKKSQKVNKRSNRYPVGFQRDAVERMKHCEDIGKLAEELGVSRGACTCGSEKARACCLTEAARRGHPAAADDPQANQSELEAKVASLEGELGHAVGSQFFQSALRRVEGLRQNSEDLANTSTMRSVAGIASQLTIQRMWK